MESFFTERLTGTAIEASDDPAKLRRLIENARRLNERMIEDAAFRRLVEIMPDEAPGTVEHDFWRSIHALEQALHGERGKTVRLARTRQKIARVGVMQKLRDLVMSRTASQGFEMLIEREMPELTAEAVVLRHKGSFADEVVAAARARLEGVDVAIEEYTIS